MVHKLKFQGVPASIATEVNNFIESINDIKFLRPDGNPDTKWNLTYGDTWDRAYAAARLNAYGAFWKAPKSSHIADVGFSAEPTFNLLGLMARDYALIALRDAGRFEVALKAMEIAEVQAKSAIQRSFNGNFKEPVTEWIRKDAGHMAVLTLASDLEFYNSERLSQHIKDRWYVSTKGYSLIGEFDSILYVAARGNPPETALLRE